MSNLAKKRRPESDESIDLAEIEDATQPQSVPLPANWDTRPTQVDFTPSEPPDGPESLSVPQQIDINALDRAASQVGDDD